jgi:DNA polymerase-3 subunit gamma/tau
LSYQVFARKWRPQNFTELVGQNHISQTLSNALKNSRLPHALLFTGPRGTGKTSSARILAKSLRCENAVDFNPCGKCSDCEDIAAGRASDVIEIDGASNNGVDAIRELREGVAFMPSSGKYKIYIIDEVHMLSTSAFNALLKTLEEPPEHVIFILATTEVHKIPQTILSRCQRFDFRRINTRVIADQMDMICKNENIQAEEDALWTIARQGDGSMRDSLSLLDQVITFANGPLKKDKVIEILGLTDRSLLIETLTALLQRNTGEVLKCLERIARSGYEPSHFATDLLEIIRSTLVLKIAGQQPVEILDMPDSELRFLRDLGSTCSEEDLHLLFDMALKGASDIPRSSEPQLVLEMVLLRMASAPSLMDFKNLFSGKVKLASSSAEAPLHPVKKSVLNSISLSPAEKWFEFVQKVKTDEPLMGAKIENLLFVQEQNKVLEILVPKKFAFIKEQLADAVTQKKLQSLIDTYFGSGYAFNLKLEGPEPANGVSAQKIAQDKEKTKQDELAKKVAEHPMVKTATAVFKGSVRLKGEKSETGRGKI